MLTDHETTAAVAGVALFGIGTIAGIVLSEYVAGGRSMSNNAKAVWLTAIICAFLLGVIVVWKL